MAKKKDPIWYEFGPDAGQTLCGLCANRGVIDTRGIRTPAGVECGGIWWCICPNGRALRRSFKGQPVPKASHPERRKVD